MRASLSLLYAAIASVVLAAPWDETWDVIVVGAGPAGLIISNRMSEAGKKTLLLEGGGPSYYSTGGRQRPKWLDGTDLSRVDVPGLYKSIFADQGNLTCTDSAAAFTGCTVGGSSAINAGLFFQPPASDFDNYFPDGWKAKDVKSAIDKCYEKLPSSEVYSQDGKFYLDSGYQAARKWLVDGVGYKEVQFNKQPDEKNGTFGRTVFDYIGGQRGGPTRVYLKEAENRTNFHLEMYTRVQRVERDGNTATGVLVKPVNGSVHTIKLNSGGRVILSGGALQSPQILMFSGIGDKAIQSNLSRAGVLDIKQAWIDNNAVGDGLFDNPNTFVELEGPTIESYVQNYSDPIKADADEYINHRSGPYSFASETSAFWDYVDRNDGTSAGCQGTIDSSGFGDYKSNQTITLNVYGTSGLKSRGKVILNDKLLPGPSPEVYYSDPQDAEDIATFIFRIFQGLDPTLLKPLNLPLNSSQQDIRKYITSETPYTRGEVNHFSSSCRIGSCVDTNTQVKGTTNIHVVDASIVEPLTVNPQFGTMIAAERAAELILKLNTTSSGNSTTPGGTPSNGGKPDGGKPAKSAAAPSTLQSVWLIALPAAAAAAVWSQFAF